MKQKTEDRNLEIRNSAVETGNLLGFEYWITKCPFDKGFNGYVVFPKRLTREIGYDGILSYVPVHGGITYAEESEIGMVYGFDSAHCDSNNFPTDSKTWIKNQIKLMINGILKAKEVEKNYLLCMTNKGKAKWVQKVIDVCPKQWQNFSSTLNVLCGKL